MTETIVPPPGLEEMQCHVDGNINLKRFTTKQALMINTSTYLMDVFVGKSVF
jgi:hypothetical protein